MKFTYTLLLVALFCGGCSFSRGSRTTPDGVKYEVTSWNFLLNRGSAIFKTEDTNGFKAELTIKRQSVAVEAIEATTEGLAKGGVKGAKGGL